MIRHIKSAILNLKNLTLNSLSAKPSDTKLNYRIEIKIRVAKRLD